jgi:hypothetical protein
MHYPAILVACFEPRFPHALTEFDLSCSALRQSANPVANNARKPRLSELSALSRELACCVLGMEVW